MNSTNGHILGSLYSAVLSGDKAIVQEILNEKRKENQLLMVTGPNQETPLHAACSLGDVDVVKALIKCIINTHLSTYVEDNTKFPDNSAIDLPDIEGITPLERAKQNSHPEIVKLLSEAKAGGSTEVPPQGEEAYGS